MKLGILRPMVGKRWLLALAGIMWMAVGLMLGAFAYSWLRPEPEAIGLPLALGGLALAIAVYRFGFVSLAARNIRRIQQMPDRACIFDFQAGKSYLMIAVMASGGALLRHSAFPKPYLAVVYLAMGGSLFLSSLLYYPQAVA